MGIDAEVKDLLRKERDEARNLLRRFVDKLEVALPKIDSIISLQAIRHSNPNFYDGPSLEDEMREAKELLK